MRLTKLEIYGFKSFARKTEIVFNDGITAIIGPNGSGKSNIADAVRWVLGEQSAKALRGSRMEDIIFNGTQERKALAYCEVCLTFDNTDGGLPVDYNEVSIMRRVYRSGESEYYINRSLCRLKDISELLRDTGIGREGYSIIGQGKVEEILSNKSDDRRNAFEEAAGVMKYRARKEEAEHKLDNTQKNLLRLGDILLELEDRMGPLEEQSRVASEYLKLRDELKDIELNVFLYQYDKLQERIKTLTATIEQLTGEASEAEQKKTSLAASCANAEEREHELGDTLNQLQNKLLELSNGVQTRAGEADVTKERITNTQREIERIQTLMNEAEGKEKELNGSIAELNTQLAAKEKELAAHGAELFEAEGALKTCDAEIAANEEKLEAQKNSIMEAMNRLSDARSQLSRFDTMKDSISERLKTIADSCQDIQTSGVALQKEHDEALDELNKMQSAHKSSGDNLAKLQSGLDEQKRRRHKLEEDIFKMEQEAQAQQSRSKVLKEMKRAHEGYYSSVRSVMQDSQSSMQLKRCIEGVVAELINVPRELEIAVEMTLGSALQNIVTPDEEAAKQVIEHLRRNRYGRATLLPVSAMRAKYLNDNEKRLINTKGCIGIASELINYDKRYAGVVGSLLGRTVIVDDLDTGIELNRRCGSAFRIATLKGDIINPGGSMTGGSVQKREFSLLGREREIAELDEAIAKHASALAQSQKEMAALRETERVTIDAISELEVNRHNEEIQLAKQREKEDIINRDIMRNAADFKKLEDEKSALEENLADIDGQKQKMETLSADIEQGNTATQEDIRRLQKLLFGQRTKREALANDVTEVRVRQASLTKEKDAVNADIRRQTNELNGLNAQRGKSTMLLEQNKVLLDGLSSELLSLGTKIEVEKKDVDKLTDQVQRVDEERQQHMRSLAELRLRREEAERALDDAREKSHRADLNLNKAQMELASMQDKIWEDYGLTYENVLPMRRQIAITASYVRIDELKSAIRELGDVNVNAIEDYKNVAERYKSLSEQCGDLERAKEDLTQLIGELLATMEQEFKEQFSLIQQNFSQVFTELFGGGRAELILSDPKDVLNCDIDIIAQPPGKKLQLLSLLSGGERALTAIALLFAILKLKPTAFCVLDEIESSLDEANVANFAGYLSRYAENTQFILITHRRGSMEVCNALYGVAMEERGVSKVVSARFQDTAS